MDSDQVIRKSTAKMLGESFLVGFASTAGMLTVFAIMANRKKIAEYTKRVTRYAIQEAR